MPKQPCRRSKGSTCKNYCLCKRESKKCIHCTPSTERSDSACYSSPRSGKKSSIINNNLDSRRQNLDNSSFVTPKSANTGTRATANRLLKQTQTRNQALSQRQAMANHLSRQIQTRNQALSQRQATANRQLSIIQTRKQKQTHRTAQIATDLLLTAVVLSRLPVQLEHQKKPQYNQKLVISYG